MTPDRGLLTRTIVAMLATVQFSTVPLAMSAQTGQPRVTPVAQPTLSGTISPGAGRVAGPPSGGRQPAAVGGISGRPIRSRRLGPSLYPGRLADAPVYNRGGSTLVVGPVSPPVVRAPAFYPTAGAPVWRLVAEEHPVQGWRLVDVDDVICYASGSCRAVTTRVMARWIPTLRGYGFRDRVGRLWQVE